MAIVELVDVSAGYSDEIILKEINLKVNPLDFIGIIGPNGGGKTTLVRIILGLLKPAKGQVIWQKKPVLPYVGYLPQMTQNDKQFPVSVKEVVLSGLMSVKHFTGRYAGTDRQKALEVLDLMGISALANKNVGDLSGGQMQRVLLGRAIISEPQLLILDEPNTFVDNRFEHDLYELLKELNKRMAILMVSHDVGTITSYVKTIACVNRNLHYHQSNIITQSQLEAYNCPIQLITHGHVPHTVLGTHHNHNHD
ncbi:MAG: metal ABC transporter ATP-binding protein [Chloroflexota bacterium]|nr:ATP-binding cassette domain-containing protein [Lentimicrobium sp.]